MPPEHTPQPTQNGELKRLRTYQSDVEETLAKKNVSLSGIAIAEGEKKYRESAPSEAPRPAVVPPAPKILRMSGVHPSKSGGGFERASPMERLLSLFNWKKVGIGVLSALVIAGIAFGIFLILTRGGAPTETAPRLSESTQTSTEDIALTGKETRAAFIARIRDTHRERTERKRSGLSFADCGAA
ncbi:MAG: hypothetical protein Greene041679_660 [Parcubacteria group bacterium Greene0416_79]|nr:MAG: hypothetical protein Greene041679_660 [Parcubacteria group bacterium Greene0416_79]